MLNTRGVGFITYTNEANASFAREAMMHQCRWPSPNVCAGIPADILLLALDHDEVLNVRWATADPNPMAQKREARRIEEQAAEAIRKALPAEFIAELEGKDPEARKRRKIESGYGLDGYEAPDEVHYARGANAVNPVGRQGYEVSYEERQMIEGGEAGEEEQSAPPAQAVQPEPSGIFSGSTLAALNKAKVSVAAKPKAAAGPLVGYGSDSDDD